MDRLEEWRYWEHVVLHYLAVLAYEVKNIGLGTTGAVNHTVNLWAKLIQELLDYWGIGAGRREYQLAGVDRRTLNLIGQLILAAVNQLFWHGVKAQKLAEDAVEGEKRSDGRFIEEIAEDYTQQDGNDDSCQ